MFGRKNDDKNPSYRETIKYYNESFKNLMKKHY